MEAKQFREFLRLDEPMVSLKVSYDGKPRVDVKNMNEPLKTRIEKAMTSLVHSTSSRYWTFG